MQRVFFEAEHLSADNILHPLQIFHPEVFLG